MHFHSGHPWLVRYRRSEWAGRWTDGRTDGRNEMCGVSCNLPNSSSTTERRFQPLKMSIWSDAFGNNFWQWPSIAFLCNKSNLLLEPAALHVRFQKLTFICPRVCFHNPIWHTNLLQAIIPIMRCVVKLESQPYVLFPFTVPCFVKFKC